MDWGTTLARVRVPCGWALGLLAVVTAQPTPECFAVGLGVAGAGELVRIWAAGYLVKNRVLTTAGPYTRTRNPLYFGTLFVGSGFALATGRVVWVVVFLVLFVAVYVPVMGREATRLSGAFPSYREYASRVPLFLPRPGAALPRGQRGPASFSWERLKANREHLTVLGWLAVAALLGLRLWTGP